MSTLARKYFTETCTCEELQNVGALGVFSALVIFEQRVPLSCQTWCDTLRLGFCGLICRTTDYYRTHMRVANKL